MNAVQSYWMGQAISNGMFTGYARANNMRLAQMFSRTIERTGGVRPTPVDQTIGLNPSVTGSALTGSITTPLRPRALSFQESAFLKDYRNQMLDLRRMAARAQSGYRDPAAALAAGSEDTAVVEATGRLAAEDDEYLVTVEQLASGQVNRSAGMEARDPMPTASGSLRLETDKGNFDFFMSGAGLKDNQEMLEVYAARINGRDTGVTASVKKEDSGKVYLELKSAEGEEKSFTVKGTLAERLGISQTAEAGKKEAVYTVRKNGGEEERFTAKTNSITIDDRIKVELKGVGSTRIAHRDDGAEALADQVSQLVNKYNEAREFLRKNSDGRAGVQSQLRRMATPPTSERSMDLIGIGAKRDGSYSFDRKTFLAQARRSPELTRSVVDNFAKGLSWDAEQGMKESSGSLVGTLEYTQRVEDNQKNPINVMSTYSKSGMYNLMNLYAVGVLMNLNA